jgi:hypothetical protein
MSILSFEELKKPLSQKNKIKWRAKHIKGDNERIEIHKIINGTNIVIVVRKNPALSRPSGLYKYEPWKSYYEQQNEVKISMNGSLWLSFDEVKELNTAIIEAKDILFNKS